MRLQIGRLQLRLPAGYGARAQNIARGIARAATHVSSQESRTLDALTVGPVRIGAASSDAQIIAAVTQALRRELELHR